MNETIPVNKADGEPLYVIAWERKDEEPGRRKSGRGTKRMPIGEALALAAELNADHQHIHHRIEPV